ncbi:GNAT family N-acetyltransferase [Bradyrhizobium sp. 2S1]|uniref:GNAT family N-acetyltransferase n=1 Tax=Bradyrhizobium sp. 2S1 TaxID=1404429 RepID=UPI00140B85C1|nr:GNAT family N-acetyltransferase [Bradyrhizobium sp. 2S1]MCK7672874.1 GNAT family N-acetyltransferase [Bradyrhizobium sp. 2S1]
MADSVRIRDYRSSDADEVNRLAVTAFDQFRDAFHDRPAMRAGLSRTSELSSGGEIIAADLGDRLAGAVGYFGRGVKKAAFFDQAWPIIRMLVVDPVDRGKGLGHALTSECFARARRDRCQTIALHTSPIMTVALPMYLRMGFSKLHDAPPIHGVPYAVYTKVL